MFWGITLEHGKTYSQIVEMPFHISMAALGFSNLADGATTIMVESDKADYALCTLQAGKIPQQPLDLNFTEGEEVKFFLEGNGGDVHLTGYLLETPREYEYEEDDELDALMSSEDDTSVTLEDEEENGDDRLSSEIDGELGSEDKELIGHRKRGRKKPPRSKADEELVVSKEDDDDDAEDDGSSDLSDQKLSLESMLLGDLDDSDDSESEDDDWKPKKIKPGKKEKPIKGAKKIKAKTSISKSCQKPISQTLINLMQLEDIEDGSESDSEWEPGVLVSKTSKNKSNGLSGVSVDDMIDADDGAADEDDFDD